AGRALGRATHSHTPAASPPPAKGRPDSRSCACAGTPLRAARPSKTKSDKAASKGRCREKTLNGWSVVSGQWSVVTTDYGLRTTAFVSEDSRVSLVNDGDARRRRITKSRMPRKNPNPYPK